MDIKDLEPRMLVQNRRRELFKISNVYANYVTAQVLMLGDEKPPRTQVRSLQHYEIAQLKPASAQAVNAMEDAWGLTPLRKARRA